LKSSGNGIVILLSGSEQRRCLVAAIKWTKDGPEGTDKIEFSTWGVRLATIKEDGRVVEDDWRTLDMFGGVLPAVGDHIATLWPLQDPDAEEHFTVVARYYIGEFAGDTCWWLLLAPEPIAARDEQMFALARGASIETRKQMMESRKRALATARALQESAKEKRRQEREEERASRPKPPRKRPTRKPGTGRVAAKRGDA
jgi:hypothetical protein